MLRRRSASGFSLIELMITLALFFILITLAVPGFMAWIANSRVRALAETLQNALRVAQAEATRRDRQAVFALTNQPPSLNAPVVANGLNWFVRVLPALPGEVVDGSYYVQGGSFGNLTGVQVVGPAVVCFNSLGRVVANDATGLATPCRAPIDANTPTSYDLDASGADRPLRVQAFMGGRIRLCDPRWPQSAQHPEGC